jgi:hypothetical protein
MQLLCLQASTAPLGAVHLHQSFGEIAGRSFIPESEIEYLAMTKPIQQWEKTRSSARRIESCRR